MQDKDSTRTWNLLTQSMSLLFFIAMGGGNQSIMQVHIPTRGTTPIAARTGIPNRAGQMSPPASTGDRRLNLGNRANRAEDRIKLLPEIVFACHTVHLLQHPPHSPVSTAHSIYTADQPGHDTEPYKLPPMTSSGSRHLVQFSQFDLGRKYSSPCL